MWRQSQAVSSPDCGCAAGAPGAVIHSFTGANKEKLEGAMQTCLLPEENPVANANSFKMQVWRSKLGL